MTWANTIVQGALLGGLYALFACGLSLMFGVMRIVNLAHGDLAVLAAFLAYSVMSATPVGTFWAVIVVIPLFALFGYAVQRGLFQRSLSVSPLSTLLVTFGLSVVIQNVLLQVYSGDTRALDIGSLVSEVAADQRADLGVVPVADHVRSGRCRRGRRCSSSSGVRVPAG